MNMQLTVKTNLEKELPQVLEFNFEEIEAQLSELLTKYENVVVTPDGVKEAKSTRADLNNFSKALNSERITLSKQWNKPFDEFKSRIDGLIGMIEKPASAIDEQIKAYETAEKEEKRLVIETFFSQNIKEFADLVAFEKLFDAKWLNKSIPSNTATNELHAKIAKIRDDVAIIKTMQLECEDNMLDAYFKTLDMGKALEEKHRFEERQKALKQLKDEKEDISPSIEVIVAAQGAAVHPLQTILTASSIDDLEETKDIDVRFFSTTAAFRTEMKELTTKHNIRYGGI